MRNIPVSKGFGGVAMMFLIMIFMTGCASGYKTSMHPPPKLKKELDSLKPNTITQKSTKYTIKKGDTIWRIAHNHGVLPDAIIRANKIKNV